MINVFGMWLVLGWVLIGWGLLVERGVSRLGGFRGTWSTFHMLWLGYAGLLAFVQLLSLVMPIGIVALALSLPPALAGWLLARDSVVRRVRAVRLRPRIFIVTICVITVVWIVVDYVACDLVRWSDTGLYHLQVVKWVAQHGTVPGLGNLHARFGYNNSVHVFGAYVDAYWEGMSAHVTNGFFLAAVLAQWFFEIFTARTPRSRLRQMFCLLTLPFLFSRFWTIEPSSLGSDLPTAVLANVLVLELLTLQPGRRVPSLMFVLAIGATLMTTKLGGLGVFAVVAVVAMWMLRRGVSWRARLVVFALPTLVILGWVIRGVMLSGWLIYPVFGRLPLSWSVPRAIAEDDLANIKSWSRIWAQPPSVVLGHGFWHWFGPWLDVFRMSHEFLLLIISTTFLAWRAAFGSAVRAYGGWAAIAACVLGLVQWFVGAPDLRYGAFLFWLLAAAAFAPMIAPVMRDSAGRSIILALSLAYCIWGGGFAFRVNAALPKLWGRLPAPQKVQLTTTDETGFHLFQPATGDQCFDAPLPCSPFATAKPRHPGSLGDGFLPRNQ